MIDVMAAGSLQFPNPLADIQGRDNVDSRVNMIFCAPDLVAIATGCCGDAVLEESMEAILDGLWDQGQALLGVPDQMQADV